MYRVGKKGITTKFSLKEIGPMAKKVQKIGPINDHGNRLPPPLKTRLPKAGYYT